MRSNELTVSDVADRLGVSRSTVLRLIEDGELEARRRTRKAGPWYVDEDSVSEYEEDLDNDDDEEDDADDESYEQGHADGYKEAMAECGEDEEPDDDEDD